MTKEANTVELYVGILLLDEDDRVFLIKEEDRNKIAKNRWNIPGGAVLPREDLLTASARLAKQEAGCIVEVISLVGSYKCHKNGKEWIFIVFDAKISGKRNLKLTEQVKKGKWFRKGDFLRLNSDEIVHPDMQLVYNISIGGNGVSVDSVKYIDYDTQ